MKPIVYPVSADLSALLGAAVDVDAAWSIDSPIDRGAIEVHAKPRGFAALFGKWPGDEPDEVIAEALREIG